MANLVFVLAFALASLVSSWCSSFASAALVEHSFHVQNLTINRLCRSQIITAVNGSLPGPTLRVKEGDTLVVHVFNKSPYNLTIHWHGIFQLLSGWADGPEYATQCPIRPGHSYTYRFTITGQEGTLWWHAHIKWLRATVHGALIIKPRAGRPYPFPKPHREVPLILGEWWNANVLDVEKEALATGAEPNMSDAYTINGRPGDLYPCSSRRTFKLEVEQGKRYESATDMMFSDTITTGIIEYKGSKKSKPIMPIHPAYNDTPIAHRFFTNLTGLVTGPFWSLVPDKIDERMFVTVGMGLTPCGAPGSAWCLGPLGQKSATSMNNASFQFPTKLSMLEAFYRNVGGIYTTDFPDNPPLQFDYTNSNNSLNQALVTTTKSTKVKKVKFNATVEIVLQNTALIGIENHPMHLHGSNFFVLAQGFGNFNRASDSEKFNLVNPQELNTIAVPVGGWAVIRFRAHNPGVWLMHCHLDAHMSWGLAMAFVVENGPTPSSRLPPPPPDFPKC